MQINEQNQVCGSEGSSFNGEDVFSSKPRAPGQLQFSPFLLISWDFFLSRPHPLHEKFSPSRGIYRLKLLIKIIFPLYFQEIKFLLGSRHFHIPREVLPISPHLVGFILSRPHPLHEKFSPSRGIYRLKILIDIIFTLNFEEINHLVGSRHFQIPREFLPISPHLVGFIKSCPDPTPSTRSSPHLVGFTD